MVGAVVRAAAFLLRFQPSEPVVSARLGKGMSSSRYYVRGQVRGRAYKPVTTFERQQHGV